MTTEDRGAILHFAGRHHLSPALDAQKAPAFSAEATDGLARCGWAPFFEAMGRRGLALAADPEDGASARFVARGAAHEEGAPTHSLPQAIEHSRRFLRALFPPGKAPDA